MASGSLETLEPPRTDLQDRFQASDQESVQPKPGPCQDFPEIVASPAEECVHGIAHHALEEVPAEQPIVFHVADLGFHGCPSAEVALEGVAEPACAADEHSAYAYNCGRDAFAPRHRRDFPFVVQDASFPMPGKDAMRWINKERCE